jgi:hypothetical protein
LGEVVASEDLGSGLMPVMLWPMAVMTRTWKVTMMISLVNLRSLKRRGILQITISLPLLPMPGLCQHLVPDLILLL